jgi:hypothetical protein
MSWAVMLLLDCSFPPFVTPSLGEMVSSRRDDLGQARHAKTKDAGAAPPLPPRATGLIATPRGFASI